MSESETESAPLLDVSDNAFAALRHHFGNGLGTNARGISALETSVVAALGSLEELLDSFRQRLFTLTPQHWNSATHHFTRVSMPLGDLIADAIPAYFSPLDWLQSFSNKHKIYWRNRLSSYETAGIGIAHTVQGSSADISLLLRQIHDATLTAPENVRYYGGMRFHRTSEQTHSQHHTQADTVWQDFPDAEFVLPFLECDSEEDVLFLHCTVTLPLETSHHRHLQEIALQKMSAELERLAEQERLQNQVVSAFASTPSLLSRQDFPGQKGWTTAINQALKAFQHEELEKVVLARRVELACAENPDATLLFRKRIETAQRATAFLLQFGTNAVFFGITPELLYQREGRTIFTEAIAGTRKRSSDAKEDAQIAEELLHSDKDRREHASVQRYIASALDELTESFSIGTVNVLKLSHLQHLYAVFSGKLRKNVDDAEILSQLHPTPAVGGTPRTKALTFLQKHEEWDRGWYAAPVGWINAHSAEFAVAIRSALVNEKTVHLFSGAGIVAGSEPEKEWQEIEMKIAPLLEMFAKD